MKIRKECHFYETVGTGGCASINARVRKKESSDSLFMWL